MLAYVGREAMVTAPPHTCDSAASPCFHGCLAFLCRHFPPWSPPSHLLDCISTVNSSPSPGIAPQFLNSSSQPLHLLGTCSPVWGMYGCGKDCLILIHLGSHRSAVSLSALNVSPLTQIIAPMWGSDSCFSSPTHKGRSSSTDTPVFPPNSFILLSFAWSYIFFSAGQVLLSTLSWCSACTSVCEDVFLMYPWRKMYSMSTYTSTILFFWNFCF